MTVKQKNQTMIDDAAVETFQTVLRGQLIRLGDADYDEAETLSQFRTDAFSGPMHQRDAPN